MEGVFACLGTDVFTYGIHPWSRACPSASIRGPTSSSCTGDMKTQGTGRVLFRLKMDYSDCGSLDGCFLLQSPYLTPCLLSGPACWEVPHPLPPPKTGEAPGNERESFLLLCWEQTGTTQRCPGLCFILCLHHSFPLEPNMHV